MSFPSQWEGAIIGADYIERIPALARQRTLAKKDAIETRGMPPEKKYEYECLGVWGEMALHEWLKRLGHWYDEFHKDSHNPDIEFDGFKIDAKGVLERDHNLLVPSEPKPDWIYTLHSKDGHRTKSLFQGWMWGHEILALPKWSPKPGRPCWGPKNKKLLHTPRSLRWLLFKIQPDTHSCEICGAENASWGYENGRLWRCTDHQLGGRAEATGDLLPGHVAGRAA